MHKQLHLNRGDRTMLVRGPDNIIYVNAAVVPRVRNVSSKSNNTGITEWETIRNFTIIDVMNNQVTRVAETWIRVGENDFVDSETILYSCMPQ
ncbi:hypothetical protein KP509_34G008700 [Ceratopteris richardii]|nr:hypothetical protein KP509_34G008700 [Ceratopteris richardii]